MRIAELEARLGQTSKNSSSKPPSSDGLAKPAPRSLRKCGARKPGGQAGHPWLTLAPVAVPDEVITHEPGCCRGCGRGLGGAVEVGREHRQVFDTSHRAARDAPTARPGPPSLRFALRQKTRAGLACPTPTRGHHKISNLSPKLPTPNP